MLRHLFLTVFFFLFSLSPLTSQTVSLTIEFEGYYRITAISHSCPFDAGTTRVRGPVGDTISCTLTALGQDSLPIAATFSVTNIADSSVVNAWTSSDSLFVFFRGIGVSSVTVRATEGILIGFYYFERPGAPFDWDFGSIDIGERVQFCGYLGSKARPLMKSDTEGGPDCPNFGISPLPKFKVVWEIGDTAIAHFVEPPRLLRAFASNRDVSP